MRRCLKKLFKYLFKTFVCIVQYVVAFCILPFYALLHAEGILAVAGVLMGLAGAVALLICLCIAGYGFFYWLSVTDVFQTHPFISGFVMWAVLTGLTGTIIIEIRSVDWSRFKKKKNDPLAEGVHMGSFKAWSQAVEARKKNS